MEKKLNATAQMEILLTESERENSAGEKSQSQGGGSSFNTAQSQQKMSVAVQTTDELPSQTVYINYDHMIDKDRGQGEKIDKL